MTTSIALSRENRASDLDYPQCEQHWSVATFCVETDGRDGPERALCCDRCVSDVMRTALLRGSFTPPVVSVVDDLDTHRNWVAA